MRLTIAKEKYYFQIKKLIILCKGKKWENAIKEELELIDRIKTVNAFVALKQKEVIGFISVWKTAYTYFISWFNAKDNNMSILQSMLEEVIKMAKKDNVKIINTSVEQTDVENLINMLKLGFRITGYVRNRYSSDEDDIQLSFFVREKNET